MTIGINKSVIAQFVAGALLVTGATSVIVDNATQKTQARKIVKEWLRTNDSAAVADGYFKVSKDSSVIVEGKKTSVPAEADYRQNELLERGRAFKMVVSDTLTDSIYYIGVVSLADTTGRLHATIRIQPCAKDSVGL